MIPYPRPRLAAVAGAASLVTLVASFWSLGYLAAAACSVLLAPAFADLVALTLERAPRVRLPRRLHGTLRRRLEVRVEIGAPPSSGAVALGWPPELGGPLALRELRAGDALASWSALPRRRGVHRAGPLWLRLDSPLGLWSRRVVFQTRCEIRVTPDLRGFADDVVGRELDDPGHRLGRGEPRAGSELRGLRPYSGGDDVRHVDWKATARSGHPVVREWEPDRRRAVLVAVDAGRLMRAESDGESKLDAAMRALARVALSAEPRGDCVGALVYSDRVCRFVPPLSGAGQAERLLRYLGDIQPENVEADLGSALPSLLGIGRRALVVVITDVLDAAGASALSTALGHVAVRHVPLVMLVRDPHLDAALAQPVERGVDAYRRAAAELVASDRARAVDLLRARGVRALDLSMASLALSVVRNYVEGRGRGAW